MILLASTWIACTCFAAENEPLKPLQEWVVESSAQLTVNEMPLEYRTMAGNLVLKDDQGKDKASIFYTAYFLKGSTSSKERPITFCFNGGPGAASAWLNIGCLGPKCIAGGSDLVFQDPPFSLEDNPSSMIASSDLVFIDPIATGVSAAAPGQDSKQFFGFEEDAGQMAEFIKLFTSKYKRWDSPKYLLGESYGAMRVIKMGMKLHDDGYYINGLILVSPAIDIRTITFNQGNDLPYLLYLPTYTAAAWYHHKLAEPDLDKALAQAEQFAVNEYSVALLKGNLLSESERKNLSEKLGQLTGLPAVTYARCFLRLNPHRFMKELLRDENALIGRFDVRVKGIDPKNNDFYSEFDPSLEAVFGAITGAYNQYLMKDLKWPEPKEYKVLNSLYAQWNWGKSNEYATATEDLGKFMAQNPKLRVFVATGSYDLATPYYTATYAITRLPLTPAESARIQTVRYPAGHMMYFNREIRGELNKRLYEFVNK